MAKYNEFDICAVRRTIQVDHPLGRPGIIMKVFSNKKYLMWMGESKLNKNYDNWTDTTDDSYEVPFHVNLNLNKKTYFVWEKLAIISEEEIISPWNVSFSSFNEEENFKKNFANQIFQKIYTEVFEKKWSYEQYEIFKNSQLTTILRRTNDLSLEYQHDLKAKILSFEDNLKINGLKTLNTLQNKLSYVLVNNNQTKLAELEMADNYNNLENVFDKSLNQYYLQINTQINQCFEFGNKITQIRNDIDHVNYRLNQEFIY